jgi:hypothetical protein
MNEERLVGVSPISCGHIQQTPIYTTTRTALGDVNGNICFFLLLKLCVSLIYT